MVESSSFIKHPGIIVAIKENKAWVQIDHLSACSQCHAKTVCGSLDSAKKTIEIFIGDHVFTVGQNVTVVMEERQGQIALVLGYVAPFFVLIFVLGVSWSITGNELLTGLFSLVGLIIYYFILWMFRQHLKSSFSFTIES